MRRLRPFVLLFLLLIPFAALAMQEDAPAPRLEITGVNASQAPTVTITANVYDTLGQPVRALTAADFALTGDLVGLATITNVENISDNNLPLSAVLAIDVSTSMIGTPLERAKQAAQAFVEDLGPNDPVAIVTFASGVRLAQDYTTDKVVLSAVIDSLEVSGATALYQGAYQAVLQADASPTPRRAVILLSDGAEYGGASIVSRESAVTEALLRGVPVYTIGLGFGADRRYLEALSTSTNARFYESPTPDQLQQIYTDLAALLRSQYVITLDAPLTLDGTQYNLALQVTTPQGVAEAQAVLRAPIPVPLVQLPALTEPLQVPTDIQATVLADDAITGVTYQIDNSAAQALPEAPYVITIAPVDFEPGRHLLTVTATDADGEQGSGVLEVNIAALPSEIIVSPDIRSLGAIAEPETITVETSGQTAPTSVSVDFNDSGEPTELEQPYSFTIDPITLPIGANSFTVTVTNEGGVTSDVTFPFTVAALPPQITVSGVEEGQTVETPTSFTVETVAQEAVTQVSASVGSVALDPSSDGTYTIDPMMFAPGANILSVRAVAGGRAGTAQIGIEVAPLPPRISVTGLQAGETISEDREIAFDFITQSPVIHVAVFVDGVDLAHLVRAPYGIILEVLDYAPGEHTMRIIADNADGQSSTLNLPFSVAPAPAATATATAVLATQAAEASATAVAATATQAAAISATAIEVTRVVEASATADAATATQIAQASATAAAVSATAVAQTNATSTAASIEATQAVQTTATQVAQITATAIVQQNASATQAAAASATQVAVVNATATQAAQLAESSATSAAQTTQQALLTATAEVVQQTQAAQASATASAATATQDAQATQGALSVQATATEIAVTSSAATQAALNLQATATADAANATAQAASATQAARQTLDAANATATRSVIDATATATVARATQAANTASAVTAQAQSAQATATQEAVMAATGNAVATQQAVVQATADMLSTQLVFRQQATQTAVSAAVTEEAIAAAATQIAVNSTATRAAQASSTAAAATEEAFALATASAATATQDAQIAATAAAATATQMAQASATAAAASATQMAQETATQAAQARTATGEARSTLSAQAVAQAQAATRSSLATANAEARLAAQATQDTRATRNAQATATATRLAATQAARDATRDAQATLDAEDDATATRMLEEATETRVFQLTATAAPQATLVALEATATRLVVDATATRNALETRSAVSGAATQTSADATATVLALATESAAGTQVALAQAATNTRAPVLTATAQQFADMASATAVINAQASATLVAGTSQAATVTAGSDAQATVNALGTVDTRLTQVAQAPTATPADSEAQTAQTETPQPLPTLTEVQAQEPPAGSNLAPIIIVLIVIVVIVLVLVLVMRGRTPPPPSNLRR